MTKATDSPEEKEKLLNGIRNLTRIMQRQIVFTKEYQEVGVHLPQWQNVRELIKTVTTPLSLPKRTLVISIENLSIYADLLLEKYSIILLRTHFGMAKECPALHSLLFFRETIV